MAQSDHVICRDVLGVVGVGLAPPPSRPLKNVDVINLPKRRAAIILKVNCVFFVSGRRRSVINTDSM